MVADGYDAMGPPQVDLRLVQEAGFAIERDELVTFEEPEGPARFQRVLAQT